MTEADRNEERYQEHLRRLKLLRPIDDDFMRCMFKDNIPLAQLVLRILTGKPDLIITSCETQKDMKRLGGARSVCLDAYGEDSAGTKYDLEIERSDRRADPRRARYHSSVMDVENLDARQDFCELPDTYTIFITEKDFYGRGAPVYVIERMNLTAGEPFSDGEHILYVNGEYRGDSEIGRLMHDFCCTEAKDMNFRLMAERTEYLKENQKGVSEMCRVIEDLCIQERALAKEEGRQEGLQEGWQEGREENRVEVAREMLRDRVLSIERIAKYVKLSLDEVKKLQAEQGL